jgi:hypothetical protein
MAILNYGLSVLKENQRVQVPVSKLSEVMTAVMRTSERLGTEATLQFNITRDSVIQAIGVAQEMKDIKFLSDNAKSILVDGLSSLKFEVAQLAYDYYSMHDFEPTEEIIPVMRDVVRTYSQGGGTI